MLNVKKLEKEQDVYHNNIYKLNSSRMGSYDGEEMKFRTRDD